MFNLFFPDPAFGWVFCVSLIFLLSIAAWTDTRTARIPNRLTVLMLILGLALNAIRGGLLAADEKTVWLFSEPNSVWVGVIDGLFFGVLGFIVAFAAMFGIWILGMVGGGDVKLLAAVAAWVGLTKILLLVWLGSVLVLFLWVGGRILLGGIAPRKLKRTMEEIRKPDSNTADPGKNAHLRVTYSLPIAVAAAVVLLWMFRFELQLMPPKPQPEQHQSRVAHAPPSPDLV